MERTIISHDVNTCMARIRFEHNGVTREDEFDLRMVDPGSQIVLARYRIAFEGNQEVQEAAIDILTANIQTQIELGYIQNPPAPTQPEEQPVEPEQAPVEPEGGE